MVTHDAVFDSTAQTHALHKRRKENSAALSLASDDDVTNKRYTLRIQVCRFQHIPLRVFPNEEEQIT